MARSRNIKPAFFTNDELADCDPLARLLFIGLWCLADSEGRLTGKLRRIKAQILPYDNCDISSLMINLEQSGFIQTYTVQGQPVIQVVNFTRHQNPHKNEREKGSAFLEYSERDKKHDKKHIDTNKSRIIENNLDKDGTTPEDSLLLIPDSLNPDSLLLIPDSGTPDQNPSQTKKKKKASKKEPPITAETWTAYCDSYHLRYNVDPVRNAKVNTQLKQFVDRIGAGEAPYVAIFYVEHNSSWYIQKAHSVAQMLADAESLRTQWATKIEITTTSARQTEKLSHNESVANKVISDLKNEESQL